MARFDVYRHPMAVRRRTVPYLVSLQTEALDFLATRVVAPMVLEKSFGPRIPFLHPLLSIEDQAIVVVVNELVAVEKSLLGAPIGSVRDDALEVIAALDYLVSGY